MIDRKWQDSIDLYKFEIGDIYWKRATLNIMIISPPILNSMYSKLWLMMNEQESVTDGNCRTKSCQDVVTCQIPNFCLDCPRVRYSIQRDANIFFFFKSLIFAWITLAGSPPRRSFLPKPPFRVFNLASYSVFFICFFICIYFFFLGKVSLNCI